MAMTLDEREAARLLGGEVVNGAISCPGPGHSPKDRSMRVWLLATTAGLPDIYAHSLAGDSWQACKEDAARRLNYPPDYWRQNRDEDPVELSRRRDIQRRAEEHHRAEMLRKQQLARAIVQEARPWHRTPVEAWFCRRKIDPSQVPEGAVLFHPRCPWGNGTALAMIGPHRCIRTGIVLGVHRTALTPDGQKIGRKMLGTVAGTAIMLDGEDAVTTGLTIGEGIETCLAARQLGLKPVWALGSAQAIAAFPILSGVDTLTVLGEHDESGTSARVCREVGTRWIRAGRTADLIMPKVGGDMNDVLMEGAATCH